MAPGTWRYLHSRPIADGYDAFVDGTPLCDLDRQIVRDWLPTIGSAPLRIADLGCGTGRTVQTIVQSGHRALAIDRSAAMLRHVVARGLAAATPLRMDLTELDAIDDGSVDAVTCLLSTIGMVRGSAGRAAALAGAARITRPGGQLLLHAHHLWAAVTEPGGPATLVRQAIQGVADRDHEFGDATYAYRGLPDMFLHRFGRRELTRLVGGAGWRVDEILKISLDGSKLIGRGIAGGFFIVARRR